MILLSQKKYPALIILLSLAAIFAILVIRPAVKYIQKQVLFYRPALTEHFPTMILSEHGGLTFQGEIPTIVTLQDSVQIFVDSLPDERLFENSKPKSIFISSEEFWYKKTDDIWKTSLADIEADVDSLVIDPIQFRQKIDDYRATITLIAFVVITLVFFLHLWILVLFAGGVGIMVDAFHVGTINYTQSVNFSSFGLLFWILLILIHPPDHVKTYLIYMLCYILCTALGVYLLNKVQQKNDHD